MPTRSIERPSRTSNPASRARVASSAASRVLPMPASPVTRTVAPLPAWAASSARSSSPSSPYASDERRARARLHAASIALSGPPGKRSYASRLPKIGGSTAKDKALRPMRAGSSATTIAPIRRPRGGDEMSAVAQPGTAQSQAGWMKTHSVQRRRRPAAARARVGQAGRAADSVHPRLVAEPSLLGEAVRGRAGRRVPAGRLRPPWPRDVRGAARARALHGREALGRRRGGDHRRVAARAAGARRLVLWRASSSPTTCARTARIESPRSSSSKVSSGWARGLSAR